VTIIERCEAVRAEVASFGALRNADSDARVLRELQARISEYCDGLQQSVVRLAVLKDEQVRLPTRLKVERLRDVVVKMRDEVSQTRRRPGDAANFLRSFKKLVDDAKTAVEDALGAYITESQTIDSASLRQLEQLPRYAAQVQVLRELQRTTPSRAAQLEPADLRHFLKRYATVRSSLREVDDLPPDVKAFLKEVDRGGARLELMTDVVRDWLTAKGLIKNVRVVISTSGSN
jgi:hypothetical protein